MLGLTKDSFPNKSKIIDLAAFLTATVIYISFAVFLYRGFFGGFEKADHLIPVNSILATVGCYLLSMRWVVSFWARFFAGAVYGFGPFMLGLASFHPAAGTLAASIPWLFCPAAFCPVRRRRWLQAPLSALPFLVIVFFFQLSKHWRLFSMPIQSRLSLNDLPGLFAPLVTAERGLSLLGVYHVPMAALIMGLFMVLAGRRLGIIVIFCLGLVPAFCSSFFDVSPLIWLAIPVLCCSVLVGEGTQGLTSAGLADRRWILITAVITAVLSVTALLLAGRYFQVFAGLGDKYAMLFVQTAKMYILVTVAVAVIFFMARAGVRLRWLRLVILCSAMAVDIFCGAQLLVDRIM